MVLAAAPPAARWSPSRHRFFPPAFKQVARQLLLANNRLLGSVPAPRAAAGTAGQAGLPEGLAAVGMPVVSQGKQGLLAAALAVSHTPERDVSGARSAESSGSDGCTAGAAGAAPPCGLPRDAVHEVLRQLASFPLSFWMKQATAAAFPPAVPSRVPSVAPVPPPPLPFLQPTNPPPPVPAGSIQVPGAPDGAA